MDLKKCCDQSALIKGLRFLEAHILFDPHTGPSQSMKSPPAWPTGPSRSQQLLKGKAPMLGPVTVPTDVVRVGF